MPIVVELDVMLARRKVRSKELAEHLRGEPVIAQAGQGQRRSLRHDRENLRFSGLPAR